MTTLTTLAQLEAIYGLPGEPSLIKEVAHITPHYRTLIEASPFAVLATTGPDGMDCSPRGDRPGFVRVHDEKTLMLPDRRGNNRIDTLRNILYNPRVGFLFLIPGSGTTLRVNGSATLSIDPELLSSFTIQDKAPRTVMVISVEAVYFQCARAIMRAELWNPSARRIPKALPTTGQMLAALSEGKLDGEAYDREWPERAKKSMW